MNNYQVLWTDTARSDLEEIVNFIAADSPENAIKVLARLEAAAAKLERMPGRGRFVPELKQLDIYTYRELIVRPWRIIYRYQQQQVFVLAVVDSRRNLQGLLLERLMR